MSMNILMLSFDYGRRPQWSGDFGLASSMRWRGIVAPRPLGRRRVRCDSTGHPLPPSERGRPEWVNRVQWWLDAMHTAYEPTPWYGRPGDRRNAWDGPNAGRPAAIVRGAMRRDTALAVLSARSTGDHT